MSHFVWVDKEQALHIHDQVIHTTKDALPGIRDESMLDSALAKPQNLAAYMDADVFDLAASYAEGIMRNHAFIDGNKRTAVTAAGLFLEANGYAMNVERNNEQFEIIDKLASGAVSREDMAKFYRENSNKL